MHPFLVLVMSENDERTERPVNLGGNHALREEPAVHAHFVVLPFFHEPVGIERSKQRNVLLCQIVDDIVAHPSVRHIDDGRRLYRVDVMVADKVFHIAHRIDHIARFFQPADQVGRLPHRAGDDDTRRSFLEQSVLSEKRMVLGNRIEAELLLVRLSRNGMVEHVIGAFYDRFRLMKRKLFAVDVFAHVVKHAPVIVTPAVAQVLFQRIGLKRVDGDDFVRRIGHCRRQDRQPFVCRLLYLRPLFFGDTKPHRIDKDHVVTFELIQLFGIDRCNFNKRIVIGLVNLAQGNDLIIDKSHFGGRHPLGIYKERRCQYDSDDPSP